MTWTQLEQLSLNDILVWAEGQPWCMAMANCVQDVQWHSEGDVWTHTKMVLAELQQMKMAGGRPGPYSDSVFVISDREYLILIFTALFHDVAKPLTTELDPLTGRVRSPKHALKGEQMARNILRDLECDLITRESIARMVRYHGRPAFLMDRKRPIDEVVRLSWMVNNRLLYLFALADNRGRDTDSMDRPEENLLHWKLISEEANCFEQPYPFSTDHARFTFFKQAEPNLHYVPYEDFACTVTMLAGLPGSGKDSWLTINRPDWTVVGLDEIREELDIDPTDNQGAVAQFAQDRCRELLRKKTSFVFNATNTILNTRSRWLDLFANYNACLEIVYVEPPLKTILQQNKQRTKSVPERVIHKLAQKCEPPTWPECHRLEYYG